MRRVSEMMTEDRRSDEESKITMELDDAAASRRGSEPLPPLERVDHFGRGLQVAADRCNSSAINLVAVQWNGRRETVVEDDHHPRHFLLPLLVCNPSHFSISRILFLSALSRTSSLHVPLSRPLCPFLSLSFIPSNAFRLYHFPCERVAALACPCLRYPSHRFPVLPSNALSTDHPSDQPSTEPSRKAARILLRVLCAY